MRPLQESVGHNSPTIWNVRLSVLRRLTIAQSALPGDVKLEVKECHRPAIIQRQYFESYYSKLAALYPTWTEDRESNIPKDICVCRSSGECSTPNRSGGGRDIEDRGWRRLDMGTSFNASPDQGQNQCFTICSDIDPEAKFNRRVLISAIEKAGFVNYPTEWWHWSYGDKYWAFVSGEDSAIYGPVEI